MSRWVLGCGGFQYKIKTMTSGVTYASHKKCHMNTVLKNTNNCADTNPLPQPNPTPRKYNYLNVEIQSLKKVFITMYITSMYTPVQAHIEHNHINYPAKAKKCLLRN